MSRVAGETVRSRARAYATNGSPPRVRATSPLRVALVAEKAAGGRVLRMLQDAPDISIEAVLASPARRSAMGSVWTAAERTGLPLFPAERVREPGLADELAGRGIDLLLNVHSLYIAHADLLEVPRLGAYNLHPGPLPEMAGLNVPSWSILLGRRQHGVTLHRMSAGIDDGEVAYQDRFFVPADATGLSLSLECVRRGVPLVARLLKAAARGERIPALPQDLSCRGYYDRRPPLDGSIDFDQPAERVQALLRAADYRPFVSPWGHPRARAESGVVELLTGSVVVGALERGAPGTVRHDAGVVRVACGEGWLELESVGVGGEARPAAEVLADGECLRAVTRDEEDTTVERALTGSSGAEAVA